MTDKKREIENKIRHIPPHLTTSMQEAAERMKMLNDEFQSWLKRMEAERNDPR